MFVCISLESTQRFVKVIRDAAWNINLTLLLEKQSEESGHYAFIIEKSGIQKWRVVVLVYVRCLSWWW